MGMEWVDHRLEQAARDLVRREPLTRMQLAAVFLSSHGLDYGDMGRAMYLSAETMRTHMKHARVRLQARSNAHAVATALRLGLIS
jgi:DNA-binding CsgD family transcriptional regulator